MKLQYDNCPNCFAALNHAEICPACRFNINNIKLNPNTLPPFTFLNRRYLLGRVLGQGGFGVTYIAQDVRTGRICAIKEYMPIEYAHRSEDGLQVAMNETTGRQVYEHGKKRFLEEAGMLVKFKNNPTVVEIWDFFVENNTAYLVMEYLDGMNLRGKMNQSGGKIDSGYASIILVTIASSLIEVHRQGVLHRDISPENIFLKRNGEIKLIDFGSARNYVSAQKQNGMSVLLKPGFAPPEQYDSRGEQGPWTDVYSLAATFYYAVSGEKLPDSLYRQRKMEHRSLSEMNIGVSQKNSKAIDKALSLKVEERYPNFEQFLADLELDYKQEDAGKKPVVVETPPPIPPGGVGTGKTLTGQTEPPKKQNPKQANDIPGQRPPVKKKKRIWSFFHKTQEVPVIKIISGRKAGQKIEIPVNSIFKIGRSRQQCHLALEQEGNISRMHCLIRYNDRKKTFFIQDISNNGTYLENGERLEKDKTYMLNVGDKFYLSSRDTMLQVDVEHR